ncbi:unnamed protein product [Brassica oleracea]
MMSSVHPKPAGMCGVLQAASDLITAIFGDPISGSFLFLCCCTLGCSCPFCHSLPAATALDSDSIGVVVLPVKTNLFRAVHSSHIIQGASWPATIPVGGKQIMCFTSFQKPICFSSRRNISWYIHK